MRVRDETRKRGEIRFPRAPRALRSTLVLARRGREIFTNGEGETKKRKKKKKRKKGREKNKKDIIRYVLE